MRSYDEEKGTSKRLGRRAGWLMMMMMMMMMARAYNRQTN